MSRLCVCVCLCVSDVPRGRKRMMELMMKTALDTAVDPVRAKRLSEASREWRLVFLRSPNRLISAKNSGRVSAVQFAVNYLEVRCSVNSVYWNQN